MNGTGHESGSPALDGAGPDGTGPDGRVRIGSFVALGDSFTEGMNDPGPDGSFQGWADRLARLLAAGNPGFRYANLAVRGKLLRQVLAEQLDPALAMRPDLVSLVAGGNDILRRADVDELAALFDQGVARLRDAGIEVLICTGFDPMAFPVLRMLRGRIAAYNMHLRAIADERGCTVTDLWSMRSLRDPRAWSPDRLHLTSDGHQRVAWRAAEALGLPAPGDWREPLPPETPLARSPQPSRSRLPSRPGPLTRPGAVAARVLPGRPGRLAARRADLAWAREFAMPWLNRRLRGTSSGDDVTPKRPSLTPILPPRQ